MGVGGLLGFKSAKPVGACAILGSVAISVDEFFIGEKCV